MPRKWAIKKGIRKGDELEVREKDGNIIVSTSNVSEPIKKTTIDLLALGDSGRDFIHNFLPLLHKCGYDEIEVIFNDPSIMIEIQARIRSMLSGYEIIEQSSSRCLIKSVSKALESEFHDLLRRVFLVTIQMANGTLENIKQGKFKNLQEQLILEETNNKLTNMCQRILNTKQYEEGKTPFIYLVVWILERVADAYKEICYDLMKEKNIKLSSTLLGLYMDVNNLFEEYYDMFYKYSFSKFINIKEKRKVIDKELCKLLVSTKNKSERIIINYLLLITQRIDDFLGSTSGLHY